MRINYKQLITTKKIAFQNKVNFPLITRKIKSEKKNCTRVHSEYNDLNVNFKIVN